MAFFNVMRGAGPWTAMAAQTRPCGSLTGTATHTEPSRYSPMSVAMPLLRTLRNSRSSAARSVIVRSV